MAVMDSTVRDEMSRGARSFLPDWLTAYQSQWLKADAIGGITAEDCGPLVRTGTDLLAVVGCIWNHPEGPAAGVKALNAAIDAAAD